MEPFISVRNLRKNYGSSEAVRGIDFEVQEGEVFGLLGPNGAGKTTTVEILEGLRPRTSGEVKVLGFDPELQNRKLKDRIGVCLQATNLPEKLTVRESLEMFAGFYSRSADCDKLIDRLQLTDKKNALYKSLSGGQKQRVAFALALINEPSLVFLDEPTTGLDPQVRLEIHSLIQELKDAKRTLVLTTHYIEEAERLCDRVAIVDEGKIIALGSPRELQQRMLGMSRIEVVTIEQVPMNGTSEFPWAEKTTVTEEHKTIVIQTSSPAKTLVEVVKWVDHAGLGFEDIHLKRPTLEDVFIELTGKKMRD